MNDRINKDEYAMKLAETAALRSTCLRRKVGAVAIDSDGYVLATAYNGDDMIIQSSEDINSFEVMPMAQEYNKYYNNMQKSKEKLSMKNSLKDLCLVNTKK